METKRANKMAAAREEALARRKKYRGVRYLPSGKYGATINELGSKKRTWLGIYPDEEVAACAYDLAARVLHGTKAKTNFDYPLPSELVKRVVTAPGRRWPPTAPAASPPTAPAPVPSEDVRPAGARLGLPRSVYAPGVRITFVRSRPPPQQFSTQATAPRSEIPHKPFSIRDYALAFCRGMDPMEKMKMLFGPRAPRAELVPAISAETCFSSTGDAIQLMDCASSSGSI